MYVLHNCLKKVLAVQEIVRQPLIFQGFPLTCPFAQYHKIIVGPSEVHATSGATQEGNYFWY